MSTLHEFDAASMERDCTCGWKAESEARCSIDTARIAWQRHEIESGPTQLEKSAIDRALWSEIGLAIGRIEAKLNAEQSDPVLTILLEHLPAIVAKLDKLNSDNQKLTVEGQRIVKERGEMLARMDERLGAIERKQIVLADDIGKTYDFIDEVRNNADAHYTSLNVTLRSIYSRLDQLKALAARRATKSSRKRAKGKRK